MSVSIVFQNKGNATLLEADADLASLECEFSSPPGCPLTGHIVGSRQRVQLKVHACRRTSVEAQRFVIRGRWVNLSRAARIELTGQPAASEGL